MMKARLGTVELCRILIESKGEIVSGGYLSRILSLSRQSVWKNIQILIEEGFLIESIPQKGYILHELPGYDLAPSYIGSLLPAPSFSCSEIYVFETLSSTQETARQLGRHEKVERVIVFSEEQTQGRGRRDRMWVSCRGSGLFMSFFFRPRLLPGKLQLVNLAAGLAVKHAVGKLYSVDIALKWPNDLLWKEKKICGILSEASSESDRVRDCCTGIGVNISPPAFESNEENEDFFNKACFLTDIVGSVHRGALAAEILSYFSDLLSFLESDGGLSLLALYRENCSTLGKIVMVTTDEGTENGRASAIGENGELIVLTRSGLISYCAADVVHASPIGD